MPDYDFKSLSSYEFALLSRDLIQAHLGVQLESFAAGPDSGIDFRRQTRKSKLIVQVKHYAASGFPALLGVLRREELPKIRLLAPTRYILATSVSLTPNRKKEITKLLEPYCVAFSDIFGREDLNNLLGKHDEIERKQFKLWLTSEPVLRRVLETGIFADSESHLERVRLRLSRYVPNASFGRAHDLLEKFHYCIIAGIPGIGKTTLAEVLLANLVDRSGFEAFRIAQDLSEIRSVKNSRLKQVFYFDDFLGKTSLGELQKNEDYRVLELMEEVASNKNWRFILTTREYILNSAMLSYEAFANAKVDFRLCVVNLADYTRSIRARILYNHIYFSALPAAHKLALLSEKGYENILRHRNYNPRVVEYMTDAARASTVSASLYLTEFINSLDHPARIWDHAFRRQVSEAARHVLLVLSTLPDATLLSDLETAFWDFYRFRRARFGFSTRSGDFNDALKELDGNFIETKRVSSDVLVSFHNPSIRDFMEDFLSGSDGEIVDLIRSAHFYEQYAILWRGRADKRYSTVDSNQTLFLECFEKKFFGPSASTIRVVGQDGEPLGVRNNPPSDESRAEFAVQIANEIRSDEANSFLKRILDTIRKRWGRGEADREDLVTLLKVLTRRGMKNNDTSFKIARRFLLTRLEEMSDFRAIAEFAKVYPKDISHEEKDDLRAKFLKFADEYSDRWDGENNPDWLRQVAADLEYVGERLESDVSRFTASLYGRADEVEQERAEREPEYEDQEDWRESSSPSLQDDIDAMFNGLRDEVSASLRSS